MTEHHTTQAPGWRPLVHVVTRDTSRGLVITGIWQTSPFAGIGHYPFVGRVPWGRTALPRHRRMDGASWGYLVAWRFSRGGFSFRYGWWADVVPGDEATLWRIPAVTGRYG